MYTSTQALMEILTVVGSLKDPKQKFIKALADYLGLEGIEGETEVIKRVSLLVQEVRNDILNLPDDEKGKAQLNIFLNPFNGLTDFSQYHFTIEQARSSFLKPDHLVNLNLVHMATRAYFSKEELKSDTKDLAEEFRLLSGEISKSELPNDVKEMIIKISLGLASVIEHFSFFGKKDLKEKLDAAIGTLVVTYPDTKKENVKPLNLLSSILSKAMKATDASSKLSNNLLKISENVPKITEAITDLVDKS